MSKKFWISTSIILFILLGISSYKLYKKDMEKDMLRRVFVNNLYFEINECIKILSEANWDNANSAKDSFNRTLEQDQKIDNELEYANKYMDRNVVCLSPGPGSFKFVGDILNYGLTSNNVKICNGFLDDGKISENEKAFLYALKEDLQDIENKMHSDKTGWENEKLTIKQVNDILFPFFRKYTEVQNLNLSN